LMIECSQARDDWQDSANDQGLSTQDAY
jgi:hypothetical protein